MTLKEFTPTAKHLAFMNELKAAIGNTGRELQAHELLAIAAQLVGNLLAYQDHRLMTPAEGMDLVARNIETGNRAAVDSMIANSGGRA